MSEWCSASLSNSIVNATRDCERRVGSERLSAISSIMTPKVEVGLNARPSSVRDRYRVSSGDVVDHWRRATYDEVYVR